MTNANGATDPGKKPDDKQVKQTAKEAADALNHLKRTGMVPAGWTFDPATDPPMTKNGG